MRVPREGASTQEAAGCDGEGDGEGLLVLVDMAGVERSGRVGASDARQAETRFILSSLTSLVNVFRAMRKATRAKAAHQRMKEARLREQLEEEQGVC